MQAAMEKLDQEDKIGYGRVSAELPGFLQDEGGKLCCFVCLHITIQILILILALL